MRTTNVIFMVIMGSIAVSMGAWGITALIGGLSASGWSFSAMAISYMQAIGMIGEYATLVEFYTYIKGVEYLIAGAFFVAFPVYFKYLDADTDTEEVSKQTA